MAAVVVGLLCLVTPTWAGENHGLHQFTTKDSIEIQYIINPSSVTVPMLRDHQPTGVPITSPDGKYFLLITQHGVLSTNTLEATLWLFDRKAVVDYATDKSAIEPAPRALAILRAPSNTPVISDVRWLDDSRRISFLGKRNSPYQQLFIADKNDESLVSVTPDDAYISAYDISGSTIAYTALITDPHTPLPQNDLVDVTGKDIYSLLFPKPKEQPKDLADLDEGALEYYPSVLHIKQGGRELPISLKMGDRPLRLFIPVLALSPDEKSLITVAPVQEVPLSWMEFQSIYWGLQLTPGDQSLPAEANPWKASQYVLIDVQSGAVSPVLDAPAGRCLGYGLTSAAIWLADSRRAILSNTFLPLNNAGDERDRVQRSHSPAVAMVDIANHEVQAISYRIQSPTQGEKDSYDLSDVSWHDQAKDEINLNYEVGQHADSSDLPVETYRLTSGKWTKRRRPSYEADRVADDDVHLWVDQDLNRSPVLAGRVRSRSDSKSIWNPNPQLKELSLGKVSVYHWRDAAGEPWTGLLALPPDYDAKVRYPVVIQTHGYDPQQYFADGEFTTGSGGRALTAKGIIVVQMDEPTVNDDSPKEAPEQLAGYESLIDQLSESGLIDRQRVGVVGFSRTCFHVLYALIHRADLFAAASITDGVNMSYVRYIMATDSGNDSFLQGTLEKTNGGVPFGEGLMNWARTAPGFNLDKVRTPLLIAGFERGQLLQQWEIYSGLRKLKKPVDMIWWRRENTPHILVQPAQRYASQQSAVDWFDFWLNHREDPDPAKVERYARWRDLLKLQMENQGAQNQKTR